MEHLATSVNVVLPLFLLMLSGKLMKRLGLFDQRTLDVMNKVNFKTFLPASLAMSIYNTSHESIASPSFLLYTFVGTVLVCLLMFLIIPRIEPENARRGVMIQGIMRGNSVIFGLPIAMVLCPEEVGTVALAVALVVPTINILSVVTLEIFRGKKPEFRKIVKGIATNPLVIGSLIGLFFWGTGLQLPQAVYTAVSDFGKLGTPLALIILGGSVDFGRPGDHKRQLFTVLAARLVLVPVAGVLISIAAGYRGPELISLLITFGAPTAVSSFTMAQEMGGDGELAGQIVVWTTAGSLVTMFVYVFVLRSLGLI